MPSFVCQVRGWRKPVHFSVTKQPPAWPIHQNSWAGLIAHCWRAQSCTLPHPPPSPGTSLTHQEPLWRLWTVFPGLVRRADSLRTWMIPRGPFLPILFREYCSRCTREPQGAQGWEIRLESSLFLSLLESLALRGAWLPCWAVLCISAAFGHWPAQGAHCHRPLVQGAEHLANTMILLGC